MKHQLVTILFLVLASVLSAKGEVSAKKKVVEPVVADTLALLVQAGDSLMQQSNTFEAYYLMGQYAQAVEAWKQHLAYNPTSIATHYNIANATYYYLPDRKQAKTYYERFLELARKEPTPNAQLQEMMAKAEDILHQDLSKKRK